MTGVTVSLEDLLDRIGDAAKDAERVSLDRILEALGHRSFGPALLLAGLVTLTPVIGDIPGVPTLMGVFVFLTAGQILLGRERMWLPGWLLTRRVEHARLEAALGWMHPIARTIDRVLEPRLEFVLGEVGIHVLAIICLLISMVMPVMEFVPFSANAAGILLAAVGLALVTRDGLLALATMLVFGVVVGLLLSRLP